MTHDRAHRPFPWFKATILLFFLLMAAAVVGLAWSPPVRAFFTPQQDPGPEKGAITDVPGPDNLIRRAPPGLGNPDAPPLAPIEEHSSTNEGD